jgi:hypothetical protein
MGVVEGIDSGIATIPRPVQSFPCLTYRLFNIRLIRPAARSLSSLAITCNESYTD